MEFFCSACILYSARRLELVMPMHRRPLGLILRQGDLDVHPGLDGDGGDLLHDLRGGVQVDDALVDPHLEAIPGLGPLAVGGLAHGVPEHLGGQAHGAGHAQLLVHSAALQLGAHFLEVLNIQGSQSDPDPVDLGFLGFNRFGFKHRHVRKRSWKSKSAVT